MTSQDQDARQLQEYLGEFYAGRIDRHAVRSVVMDLILARIGCQRVSMWKFAGAPGRLSLLCFAAKTAGGELDTGETRLAQGEYRDYFNALIERGLYVASDALAAPALQPMRANYLMPNNVLSLLDAAFMLNGRAYGMVCCEETQTQRDWRVGDVSALRAIVTRLALIMSSTPESILWATPSLPLQALTDRAPDRAPPARTEQRGAARKG
jgi:GAF domain-containing protein